MYWENVKRLCLIKGISPTKLTQEIGIAQSNVLHWKQGTLPRPDTLRKIADYFGCDPDDLTGDSLNVGRKADPEMEDILQELKDRPDKRMLFSVTKNATPEQVLAAVQIIEIMKRTGGNNG